MSKHLVGHCDIKCTENYGDRKKIIIQKQVTHIYNLQPLSMWQFDDLKQDASDGSHNNESDLENLKRSGYYTFLILEFLEK